MPNLTAYVESARAAAASEPAWLADQRRLAAERFSLLGIPTTRHEDYKYTNLKAIASGDWQSGPSAQPGDLSEVGFLGDESARLVFVNGRLASATGELVGSLAQNLPEVEGHLTRYADFEAHATTALNTALFEDGALIRVPAKAVVEKPIHIVWVATGEAGEASHPRTLILAGRESQMKVAETFISLSDGQSWTNQVTEIVAEDGARVEHFKIQQESLASLHTGRIEGLQERNASISTISLSFGAALARNDVNVTLDDEGGEAAIDGLFVVDGKQHVDHHTVLDHAKPNCNSHQLYKGILDDSSRGVFNGKIIVRKDAQKTDAIQNNKNLLLSSKAEVDTKPQLEIDADDVRCTHGATIGQLSAESLFYLRSRGIPQEAARGLLIYAFAADLLNRITIEPLKLHFEHELMRKLATDSVDAEETLG